VIGPGPQRRFVAVAMAPALVLFTGFVAIPGVRAFVYSVQDWDGLGAPEWAGLENFRALFSDGLFYRALAHNAILMFGGGAITIALALFFANLAHRGIRGGGVYRVAFFFPNVIASVAVAVLWLQIYSTNEFGLLNALLGAIQRGLGAIGVEFMRDALPVSFTESRTLVYALIPVLVWTATGFYMVLFLAAMEGVPQELYESATLDGATGWQQFLYVTFPLIREVLVVGLVFFIISTAKFFDPVWVMENAYPTADSHVLATLLYQKVFSEYDVGYAAAVAVVLFGLVFAATVVTLRLQRREALEY